MIKAPSSNLLLLMAGAAGGLLILLILMALSLLAVAAPEPLPPRPPTPTPTPIPTPTPPPTPVVTPTIPSASPSGEVGGGWIELRPQFPAAWPWERVHWQELWTVVQWRDEWGRWHTVEGWQGGLNGVTRTADGLVAGQQWWWVDGVDLGKGPFRWLVFRHRGGPQIGASELFYLPDRPGQVVPIEVVLSLVR